MEKPERKKAATISDIARAANTSIATASRVLSNSDYPVSAAMREKVKQIAKELNYSPNLLGRMLKKNEASDIGVIIPTVQNPFYTEVLIGIESEVKKNGYDILLYNSFRNVKTERRHIEKLSQKQVKGIILSSVDSNSATLREFIQAGGTVVSFDQDVDIPGCIKIKFDFIKASRMAVEYLISMGHKNIAFLSSPIIIKSRIDNLEGYKQALAAHNIDLRPENILTTEKEHDIENGMYEFENGKELAKLFLSLKDRPTAIFAVNDITAMGIIQQLAASGLSVPEDVSVIGFDNIEISKMISPPLTTISQSSYETGRMAGKILINALNEKDGNNNFSVFLEPFVVERKSVREL